MEKNINLKKYDFYLPQKLIAQRPEKKRDDAKLLIYNRKQDKIIHTKFYNIPEYIENDYIIVMNKSKVMPHKIVGRKKDSKTIIDIVLIDKICKDNAHVIYSGLTKLSKIKNKTIIVFDDNTECEVIGCEKGVALFKFNINEEAFNRFIERNGYAPLPPYIKRDKTNSGHLKPFDRERYQTIYADISGSVAAPTAGLHFTDNVVQNIKRKGIDIAYIILHVGLGTFKPIKKNNIIEHEMLPEYYYIDKKNEKIINKKYDNKKILSIGTTSTRCLESYFMDKKINGFTNMYIYPGHEFHIDALLTNFHVPHSTPLMLLAGFIADYLRKQGEKEYIEESSKIFKKIYKEAIEKQYRFYSYGDSMLVV